MKTSESGQAGFSLIEVVVSMGILGILSGLSMSVFSQYQYDAYNALALSQIRLVISGEEALHAADSTYVSCANTDCVSVLKGIANTPGIRVQVTGTQDAFSVAACHARGDIQYSWVSTEARMNSKSISVGSCSPTPEELT